MKENQIGPQLFYCFSDSHQDLILKGRVNFEVLTKEQCLSTIKGYAIVRLTVGSQRSDLLSMTQDPGEPIREFQARVKGKGDLCAYQVMAKCSCATPTDVKVDFTDVIFKDVIVLGISDEAIKQETLGWTGLDNTNVNNTVIFIESKKIARNAMDGSSSSGAISSYKKSGRKSNPILKMTSPKI